MLPLSEPNESGGMHASPSTNQPHGALPSNFGFNAIIGCCLNVSFSESTRFYAVIVQIIDYAAFVSNGVNIPLILSFQPSCGFQCCNSFVKFTDVSKFINADRLILVILPNTSLLLFLKFNILTMCSFIFCLEWSKCLFRLPNKRWKRLTGQEPRQVKSLLVSSTISNTHILAIFDTNIFHSHRNSTSLLYLDQKSPIFLMRTL